MTDYKKETQAWKELTEDQKRQLFSLKENIEVVDGVVYDRRTGEDVTERVSVTLNITQDQANAYKVIKELQTHQKDNGGFVFAFISESQAIQERFPSLTQADYAILIFMSTYLSYNSGYFNYCYLVHDNGKKMDKKALKALLGVSRNKFPEFYKKLVAEGILLELPEGLAINPHVFYRGTNVDKISTDYRYTRVFKQTIRELYGKFTGRTLAKLGVIYAILPYINFNYNTVCKNPTEVIPDKVKPMEIKQLAKELGFADYKHLAKTLKSIKYKNKAVFLFVTDGSDTRKSYIIVNPNVVYAGNGKHLESIKVQFN
ncbi:hypothetical protein [Gracilibacillus timonensis]|uniref:hypothetical protein n=1 Tax=Gracilibacillus timonensis TaxID=1816696 RepID=UPI00082439FF|nr:hypothetical protein [Gracilibacillus timonensis]